MFMLAVGAIAVIGLAAVAYFASTRSTGESASGLADGVAQNAEVTVAGDSLSPLPEGMTISGPDTDPLAGQVAPTLTGTGFGGDEVMIEANGAPKAIYFLAHWCPHCQAEVPLVQSMIDEGRKPEALEIYAVSTAVDRGQGNYPPSTWLEGEGFSPPVIRDDADSSAFRSFGGGGFPYVVYLDSENKVVARTSGSLDATSIEQLWQLAVSAG